jgi:predicted ATP-grasp superfamily ATP-dependent carboligase
VTAVVVTDISSYKAVVIARFLKRAYPGLRVIGTDHRPIAKFFRTRWLDAFEPLNVSPKSADAYAAALKAVAHNHGATHLIPVNSSEIRGLMERRAVIGALLDYVGSSDLYRQLDDKQLFAALIDAQGLPQPRARARLDEASLPLVLKPTRGSSAKGLRYIRTEEERAAILVEVGAAPEGYLIQDFVEGEGIGFSGFFRDGHTLVGYAHRRVAEYPVSGGSSAMREAYPYGDAAALEALVARVLNAAPWSGFAMFELKRRGPEDFVFIECNPRIWGSIHQGLADGINYFEPLLGQAAEPAKPARNRIRTELFPLSWMSLLGYSLKGKWSVVADMCRTGLSTRLDINPITDPGGFVALLARGT